MERIKYNGVDGVFIPKEEFEELQLKLYAQRELINEIEEKMKEL